jgi:hypothetical protein
MKFAHTCALLCLSLFSLAWADDPNFEAAFDNSKLLNDQQQNEANNYNHQGRNQRILQEKCSEMNKGVKVNGELQNCDDSSLQAAGQTFKGKTGQTLEQLIPIATKAYSTVLGLGGMNKINATISQKSSEKKALKELSKNPGSDKVQDKAAAEPKGQKGKFLETSNKDIVTNEKGEFFKADGTQLKSDDALVKDLETKKEMKEKEKEYEDWCSKLPMVTELVAGATQALDHKKIESTEISKTDYQRESLSALKRSHLDRKKTATIQTIGWGATSACYIGYATTVAGAASDWKLYLKLAASGFLTYFYGVKIKKHQDYANALDGLMAELPKKGECNPHTATHCFCAEQTSQQTDPANFQKYCLPSQYIGRQNPYESAVCVDSELQIDNECKCRKSRSCVTDRLKMDAPIWGLGQNYATNALKDMNSISGGSLMAGKMGLASAQKMAARANQLLKEKAAKENIPAGKVDKMIASELEGMGVPRNVALALSGTDSSGMSDLLNKNFDTKLDSVGLVSDDMREAAAVAYDNSNFKLNNGSKNDRDSDNPYAALLKKKGQKESSGVEIMDFQNMATAQAEITKDSNKAIFDIISHRYRSSAWRKFELDKKIEFEEKKAE